MEYAVVIAANGKGERLQLGYNKVYYRLDGECILSYSIDVFEKDDECKEIIVVTDKNDYNKYMKDKHYTKVKIIEGSTSRQASIYNGLCEVKEEIVMVHDGARPYINSILVTKLKVAMKKERAALLMVACTDTIKVVKNGYVEKTIDRKTVYGAQTPQVFYRDDLLAAYNKAIGDNYLGTDDASIIEKYTDIKIKAVEGDYQNKKITTKGDLSF